MSEATQAKTEATGSESPRPVHSDPEVEIEEAYLDYASQPEYPEHLRAAFQVYADESEDFEPGDLITWKSGMRNLMFPHYNRPAVYIGTIPAEARNRDSIFLPRSRAEFEDCYIGWLDGDSDLLVSRAECRRFTRWELGGS